MELNKEKNVLCITNTISSMNRNNYETLLVYIQNNEFPLVLLVDIEEIVVYRSQAIMNE